MIFYFILFYFIFILFIIVGGYFIERSRGTKVSQGGHITVTRSRDRKKDVEGSERR